MEHYLDNSATTVTSPGAAQKAFEIMTRGYGNPSSLHLKGLYAEQELEKARRAVAKSLGAYSGEIFFTSGGTEANNTALFGTAMAKKRRGNKIIVSALEHSSVLEAADKLAENGFEVARVKPGPDGIISVDAVLDEVDSNTIMASVMTVNNETGAIMPVAEIFSAVKAKNSEIICHTDAVQAFGKIPLSAKRLNADLISVSGHKVHAPKGCGALFVRKGVRIIPLHYGGGQEGKIRPGTQALPLIAAFGVACGEFKTEDNLSYVKALCDYAKERLSKIDGVVFNSPQNALPYVLNISAGNVRSETLLHFLEELDVFISSGSACARGKPSYVLSAMGLDRRRADSALRISFSKYSVKEDVDALCRGIEQGLGTLARR